MLPSHVRRCGRPVTSTEGSNDVDEALSRDGPGTDLRVLGSRVLPKAPITTTPALADRAREEGRLGRQHRWPWRFHRRHQFRRRLDWWFVLNGRERRQWRRWRLRWIDRWLRRLWWIDRRHRRLRWIDRWLRRRWWIDGGPAALSDAGKTDGMGGAETGGGAFALTVTGFTPGPNGRNCYPAGSNNMGNQSPKLDWGPAPTGTMSWALTTEDLTAKSAHQVVCTISR